MKYYTYQQAAEFCGFKTKAGLYTYIEMGVFPKATIPQPSRDKPMLWSEKDVLIGLEGVKAAMKTRNQRAAANREITRQRKKRELKSEPKKELPLFDRAMRLMKPVSC